MQKEGLYSLWILSSCQAPGDMLNIPTPAAWKTAHPFCPFMENNIFLGNCSIHQHLSKYPFPLDQCMKVMSNDKEGHTCADHKEKQFADCCFSITGSATSRMSAPDPSCHTSWPAHPSGPPQTSAYVGCGGGLLLLSCHISNTFIY